MTRSSPIGRGSYRITVSRLLLTYRQPAQRDRCLSTCQVCILMPVLTGCYDDDGITYIKRDRVGYVIILKTGRLDSELYFKSIVSFECNTYVRFKFLSEIYNVLFNTLFTPDN